MLPPFLYNEKSYSQLNVLNGCRFVRSATFQLSALAVHELPVLLQSAITPGVDCAHEQRRDQAEQAVAAPKHGEHSQQPSDDTDCTRSNLDVGVACTDKKNH